MTEIKFRAKTVETGEWVYGVPVINQGANYMIETVEDINYNQVTCMGHEIIPETVGQSTGMKDKNGKDIYEKDICNNGSIVEFIGGRYLLVYQDGTFEDLMGCSDEVIGNIHENS
jgi:uncharacterized phage protein (TIGR01671 family)